MADDLATDLDGGGYIAIDEVQSHFRRKGLRCIDALEVDVQDLLLVWVPLHGAQQDLIALFAVQIHIENGCVELFFAQGMVDFVVVELDAQRIGCAAVNNGRNTSGRSEEHTSELQSLMRISYAVFCLKKKKNIKHHNKTLRYNTQDSTLI